MVDATPAPTGLGHTIVCGDDRVALAICSRLNEYEHDGCVLVGCSAEAAREVVCGSTRYVAGDPTLAETLVAAEVATARSLLLLSADDRLNLQVAMRARDLNPTVRIVLRQFNRALGRKIEAKLPNTTVVSLAAQSAVVFASATVDPAYFYGVQFPDIDGPLYGFAERDARDLGATERILSVEGELPQPDRVTASNDRIVTFGPVVSRHARQHARSARPRLTVGRAFAEIRGTWRRLDPLARRLTLTTLAFFACATLFFALTMHADPVTAAYFVASTMTTTGYGDVVPRTGDHVQQLAAIGTMLAGLFLTGIFVALVAANFTQARYRAQQGVRQIDATGHIVVAGAGRVGSRVIDYLLALDRKVVVIERDPRAEIVERARNREFALLTGDATADATLALCNIDDADAVVALTESDTMNLEVVLGAQAIDANIPVVMRVNDSDFAASIARHFHVDRTFGATDLVGPVLAALSFTPDVRGFIDIGGRDYAVSQMRATEAEIERVRATPGTILLVAFGNDRLRSIETFADIEPDDLVLLLFPAYRFRKGASARAR